MTTPPRPVVGMYGFRTPDARRLGNFWAEVMRLPVSEHSTDDLVMLDLDHELAPQTWLFQRDPDAGAPTTRFTLDISDPDGDDHRRLADRAERAGAARHADREVGGVRWIEMTDPDGNPFRVFAPRPQA